MQKQIYPCTLHIVQTLYNTSTSLTAENKIVWFRYTSCFPTLAHSIIVIKGRFWIQSYIIFISMKLVWNLCGKHPFSMSSKLNAANRFEWINPALLKMHIIHHNDSASSHCDSWCYSLLSEVLQKCVVIKTWSVVKKFQTPVVMHKCTHTC